MDERQAQFLISVGRLCAEAHLARLHVELELAGGRFLSGVPAPPPPADGPGGLDDTGYADAVAVDGTVVAMSDVLAIRLRRPGAPSTPAAEEARARVSTGGLAVLES